MADAADARRKAEEALGRVLANAAAIVRLSWSDGATPSDRANLEKIKSAAADIAQDHKILRALLAAGPEAKHPGHNRIGELETLLRECNAVCLCGCPDAEHEADECGEGCGHDDHECIRVAPAVLEIVQRYRVALSDALAQKPAGAEVREAEGRRTVMDAKKLAAMLDGRQMGSEITEEEEALAREAGIVVVFGYSDDNVELRGAIDDEASAYNGTTVYLGAERLLQNDCDDDRCPYFLRERAGAPRFRAKWNNGDGAAWSYEVPWPHKTFRVMEDGDLFCVGVVFALADVPALRGGQKGEAQ